MNRMTDRNLTHLSPLILPYADRLIADAAAIGLRIFVDSTWRSPADQLVNWQKGRDEIGNPIDDLHYTGIVTWAPPGQSPHENTAADGTPAALAFDIALYNLDGKSLDWSGDDAAWTKVHNIARAYHDQLGLPALTLGIDWSHPKTDPAHFELANWKAFRATATA